MSEDGFLTKAHQAVLASTSTYFERVLQGVDQHQHPMVVLRGANLKELTCLLDFMYQGNTEVCVCVCVCVWESNMTYCYLYICMYVCVCLYLCMYMYM